MDSRALAQSRLVGFVAVESPALCPLVHRQSCRRRDLPRRLPARLIQAAKVRSTTAVSKQAIIGATEMMMRPIRSSCVGPAQYPKSPHLEVLSSLFPWPMSRHGHRGVVECDLRESTRRVRAGPMKKKVRSSCHAWCQNQWRPSVKVTVGLPERIAFGVSQKASQPKLAGTRPSDADGRAADGVLLPSIQALNERAVADGLGINSGLRSS